MPRQAKTIAWVDARYGIEVGRVGKIDLFVIEWVGGGRQREEWRLECRLPGFAGIQYAPSREVAKERATAVVAAFLNEVTEEVA